MKFPDLFYVFSVMFMKSNNLLQAVKEKGKNMV